MSVFTHSSGQINTDVVAANTPDIVLLPMILADTEYSVALPVNCRQYLVQFDDGSATGRVSFSVGGTSGAYVTIPRYCFYSESDLKLTSIVTLYLRSNRANQVARILTWI